MIDTVFALLIIVFLSVVTVDLIRVQSQDNKCIQLGGTPTSGKCVKVISMEVK